ncbi:MAG TPA: hypothetical protein VGM27_11875, partial [Acidobacteriaceae bacterium]
APGICSQRLIVIPAAANPYFVIPNFVVPNFVIPSAVEGSAFVRRKEFSLRVEVLTIGNIAP